MSKKIENQLNHLFESAEAKHRYLAIREGEFRQTLKRHCKSGLVSPAPGIFVRQEYFDSLTRPARVIHLARALAELHSKMLYCGLTAATILGLYVSWRRMDEFHLVGDGRRRQKRDLVIRTHPLSIPHRRSYCRAEDVWTTDLKSTVFFAAAQVPFPEALALMDSAMRFYELDRAHMRAYVNAHGRGRHGVITVRRALEFADPQSENGGESIARGIMIDAGFMPPDLQVEVADPLTGASRRVDYYWKLPDGCVILGEFDGHVKFLDALKRGEEHLERAARVERLRESRLTVGASGILRISSDMLRNPERIIELLKLYGVPRVS